MIILNFPLGSFHGWGICGKYLTRELSKLANVKLIEENLDEKNFADALDYNFLKNNVVSKDEAKKLFKSNNINLIQAITSKAMLPITPELKADLNIGYTFFEDNILLPEYIENAKKYFDIVVTGSTWCEEILKNYGLHNTKTVIQGIDPQIFNPNGNQKEYFKDKFVIFSGGKFELRKGQDLVIKAFKILQDKYDDVLLVNSWFNLWESSFNTMKASPFIKFSPMSGNYVQTINKILHDNGINLDNVITLKPQPNYSMARIYKNTDIGLFPNRCEGGTNLVLMEYMACGKPAIASYNSGHIDILNDKNSIMLKDLQQIKINDRKNDIAAWDCPTLDEIVANLEWAYKNRKKLKRIGDKAGQNLSHLTWEHSAKGFYEIIKHNNHAFNEKYTEYFK